MAFDNPLVWTTDMVITADRLNEFPNAVTNILNGALTTANLDPAAGIASGQLAAPYTVETIYIPLLAATYIDRRGAGVQIAVAPFPGLDNSLTFTILACTIMTSNYGAGSGTLTMNWGSYAGGTFTTVSNIFTAQTVSNNLVTPTLANSTFQQNSGTQRGFQVLIAADDATAMNDAGDQQMICMRIKHYLIA